jgi:hypothetical protein
MTELHPTPVPATLVAIDISKHRHEVLIEAPGHAPPTPAAHTPEHQGGL